MNKLVRTAFDGIADHRKSGAVTIKLGDALQSALALFALKDPSLLAFDDRRNDQNMKTLFGIDQIQQLACPLFRAVWKKLKTKRSLWEKLRSHFHHCLFTSMQQLYETILYGRGKEAPLPPFDTSSFDTS